MYHCTIQQRSKQHSTEYLHNVQNVIFSFILSHAMCSQLNILCISGRFTLNYSNGTIIPFDCTAHTHTPSI